MQKAAAFTIPTYSYKDTGSVFAQIFAHWPDAELRVALYNVAYQPFKHFLDVTERDLDKDITLGPGILPHFATEENKTMKLREIIKLCKRIYCEYLYPLFRVPHPRVIIPQVVPSVSNTSTFLTRSSATGSGNVSKPQNHGTTLSTRSV